VVNLSDSSWEERSAVTEFLGPSRDAVERTEPMEDGGLNSALAAQIGEKYEVLRRIGSGGMAEVYLARHRKHDGLFAVQVLSPALADDPRVVARFLQEGRTAATLSGHPNIVTIFDVGEAGKLYYIIMQYVEGEDLDRYLARCGRLTATSAIQVIRPVADALAA